MSTAASARSKSGVAYDSVTKLVPPGDLPLRPGNFYADFRAGQHPSQSCMPSLIRRYVTTRKERIDEICKQEATIVDCDKRTVIMLDFSNKVYRIVSLDANYDDVAADASALSPSGMTSTITIERAALGSKDAGGVLTDEFTASNVQSIVDTGSTVRFVDRWSYYFATTPLPVLACIDVAAPWLSRYGTPQRYEPELQRYFDAWRSRSRSSHFLVTERGPELPPWRIVLYSIWQRFQSQSDAADSNYFLKLESGNIRSIDDDDSAFNLPSGFTKIPQ